MDRRRLTLLAIVAVFVFLLLRNHTISHTTLILLAVLAPSIVFHEVSHGVVAYAFGDDTAKQAGRLTLNPIAHVDPFGSILLPALLAFSGAPPFGYAKPVPVNPRRLRHPRNHSLLVSLAGPVTNLTLVTLATVALHIFRPAGTTFEFVYAFAEVNIVLAVFNLIPIPPLDGSAVLERLMPTSWWPNYLRFRQYSMLILFVLVFWLPGGFGRIINPPLDFWFRHFVSA
jgi:Zn-dependent protease